MVPSKNHHFERIKMKILKITEERYWDDWDEFCYFKETKREVVKEISVPEEEINEMGEVIKRIYYKEVA